MEDGGVLRCRKCHAVRATIRCTLLPEEEAHPIAVPAARTNHAVTAGNLHVTIGLALISLTLSFR